MPRKKQSPEQTKDNDKSKGSLGQREADLQKSGKMPYCGGSVQKIGHIHSDDLEGAEF